MRRKSPVEREKSEKPFGEGNREDPTRSVSGWKIAKKPLATSQIF
jgi:hypothetical protein